MTTATGRQAVWRTALLAMLFACVSSAADGQPGRPAPDRPSRAVADPSMVEVAPIRCWWRASKGAVVLGEPFDVRLTCAVLETGTVQVVPDESRLTVSAVQLRPFEVMGGDHPGDTRAGQRRFFQYRYTVRLLEADSVGQDVVLPNLAITYKVESRVAADAVLAGRDFTYVMPGLPVRILSLAPDFGVDIRDGADVGLERIEALRFRARLFDIGAIVLLAGAALMGVLVITGLAGRTRTAGTPARSRAPGHRVLAAARRELARVAGESAGGWSPELVSAAHAALRLVAAVALGRGVGEQAMTGDGPTDGRLAVRAPLPWRRATAVSSATTADEVARALAALPPGAPEEMRRGLEALHAALTTFTRSRFASGAEQPDGAALSSAVEAGRAEAGRLARDEWRAMIHPAALARRWWGRGAHR